MAEIEKMCQKSAFLVVPDFGYPQSRGPPWKLAHWKCCPNCFWWLLYMLGVCHFIFATFSNEKVFTVTANVTVTVVPLEFWNLTEIWKNIFKKYFEKYDIFGWNIYQSICTKDNIHDFLDKFLIFFIFLRIFQKKNPVFLKSMTKIAPLPQPIFAIWFRFLAIFHQPWTPWAWWKIAKSVLFCSRWPVEAVLSKFSKNLYMELWARASWGLRACTHARG